MSAYYNFNVASSLLSDHLWAQSSGLQRHGSHHGLQAVDGHCKNSCDLKITVRSTTMLLGLPWFTFTQSFSMLLSQGSYILTAVVVLHLDCTPDLELLYRASFQLVNSDGVLPSYWKPIWFAKEAELVAVACRAQSIRGEGHPSQKGGRHENSTVVYILCSSQVQRKHGLLVISLFALMLKNSACKDCRQHDGNYCCCCLDTSPGHLKLTRGWNSGLWALAKTTLEKSEALFLCWKVQWY
jgi:hypothetical protein